MARAVVDPVLVAEGLAEIGRCLIDSALVSEPKFCMPPGHGAVGKIEEPAESFVSEPTSALFVGRALDNVVLYLV